MFVSIKYWRDECHGYTGSPYTYETHLPLKYGDRVITPTVKAADQRGIVVAVDVPSPKFPCREITEYYKEEE